MWQYVDPAAALVSSSAAADLAVSSHLETLMARMNLASLLRMFDSIGSDELHPDTASRLLSLVRQMLELVHGGSEVATGRTGASSAVCDVVGVPVLGLRPNSPTGMRPSV